MSIDLTSAHHDMVESLAPREAVLRLLTDQSGPLGDCASPLDDAPTAYMLATLYRAGRRGGLLSGKPGFEAQALFASRVRTTARRALNPTAWMVSLSKALGVCWESVAEQDRVWWRAVDAALMVRPDGALLAPPVSLLAYLRATRPSLIEDLHSRTADLSARWFYGLLDEHRAQEGYGGVLLGLRAQESHGRRMNRATRGHVYQRSDGLHVGQPLADWSALDVHAYLWREQVPLLPVYLCVDPGVDALALRKSWWVCGGGPARMGGHYTWLRRWWPQCWRLAVEIDPEVATIS